MPIINSFKINTNDLTAVKATRSFNISGQPGSEFIVQVVNNASAFYNWKTKTFTAGHIPESNLKKKLSGNSFGGSVSFPASASATYNVILIALAESDTFFSENLSSGGKNVVNKSITQVGNSTITFALATANTNSYSTNPAAANKTSVGSPVISGTTSITSSWTVANKENDANGFGLRLIRQPVDTDWYFTTTDTVDGAVSSGTSVTVDSLTDLAIGTTITGVSSGSLSGTPTITAINTSTKTLTISVAQTFADGITLTFQARGASAIERAIGLVLTTGEAVAKATSISKTVRANVSASTSITLTNTHGISGGGFVSISGGDVNNDGDNTVQTVTADADASGEDGVAVMQLAQTIGAGTVIYFSGSVITIVIALDLSISTYPDSSRTIYLNLDNFITPGVSGS